MERATPLIPNVAQYKEEIMVLPEGGKEIIAVTQRVPEIDGIHREMLVGNARAAVQIPVEFLVPHQRREVHVVEEATQVFATSKWNSGNTRNFRRRPARREEPPATARTARSSSSRSG